METIQTVDASVAPMSSTQALRNLTEWRDPEAWAAILERHGAAILALARRITGDAALSEDVCQETLLQIRAHAGQFVPPAGATDAEASARGWIMRIASCTAFRMLRTRQRSDKRETIASREAATEAPSAQQVALAREQHDCIKREVAMLPETLREPLSLHYFGMMQYSELGSALGCSEEAAKKRVQRGVALLRSRLATCGIVLTVGSLSISLASSSAQAAEVGVAAQSAAAVLDAQHLAAWQGLLNSTSAPALSGVATMGGMTLMTKYVLGAAAAVLFGFSTVEALQIQTLKSHVADAQSAALRAEGKLAELERRSVVAQDQMSVMKQQLSARNEEVTQMHDQIAELKKQSAGARAAWGNGQATINFQPGQGAVAFGGPEIRDLQDKLKATINGNPIEFNIPLPPGGLEGKGNEVRIELDKALKELKDANGGAKEIVTPNGNVRVMVWDQKTTAGDPNRPANPQAPGAPAADKGVKPPAPPGEQTAPNF